MKKSLNICKVSNGYLCTIKKTIHLATKDEVRDLARHEGLRYDDTAKNEVFFDEW